uniref:TGF-beta family profile domain-containing protein n=1 Tax=Mola mola TaxID=94237 RepID=A0A3Q3VK18_MOLML
MLTVDVFYCGALMLCCTGTCVALQLSHGRQLTPAQDPTMTGQTLWRCNNRFPQHALCFMDDILAALRDSMGIDGELTNHSLALFGICTAPGCHPAGSVLLQLAKETSRKQRIGLQLLHPAGVHVKEDIETGALELTFDLPQFALLKLNPVLLLAFESPLTGENLDVTFTSQSLQPGTQSVCISGETQYMMLTGNASHVHLKRRISAETTSPDMRQSLRDALIGRKSGRKIRMTPLLLFSRETGTDTRLLSVSGSVPASSQISSFLCELKRFLGDVMSQDHPESPPLQLTSLQSLPPLTLGLSSSEALLAGLINSSTLTVFSFSSCCSALQGHRGELALSPVLLEELGRRLEQAVIQTMGVIREEEVGHRAPERLGRLVELSAFLNKEPATGESQYCAFLLLKALQTVARTYEVKRGLRAARADPSIPVRGDQCGLRSLTVSLERLVIGPNTANIYNCHGSCAFPLVNPSNHAILLNSYMESTRAVSQSVDERGLCCVPVAYEDMDLVLLDAHGTGAELKPLKHVVAKECGCR